MISERISTGCRRTFSEIVDREQQKSCRCLTVTLELVVYPKDFDACLQPCPSLFFPRQPSRKRSQSVMTEREQAPI